MKLALEFALSQEKCVCLRYPRDLVPSSEFEMAACKKPFELGKSVVVRKHKDSVIAIVAYGSVLTEALKAARLLADDGIEVDLINARFAAPVDKKIISFLKKCKGIITVEDHDVACGFGSAVLETAAAVLDGGIAKPIVTLGVPNRYIKQDTRDAQLMDVGINADNIAKRAREMIKIKNAGQKSSKSKYTKAGVPFEG
jgi:1-deoxy-D-xylulose-5-phosphate synthase